MFKLLLGSFLAAVMLLVSGCSAKTANTADTTCIGCEGLPDCIPGPYGDCLPKTKK